MIRKCFVYGLVDNVNGNVFYIGSTIGSVESRVVQHRTIGNRKDKKYRAPVYYWIKENKISFHHVILETKSINVKDYNAVCFLRAREKYWINKMIRLGHALKNVCYVQKVKK